MPSIEKHIEISKQRTSQSYRKSLIMDLAPDNCKAGMFGLYYLIRDIFVSLAALGGAFLWPAGHP